MTRLSRCFGKYSVHLKNETAFLGLRAQSARHRLKYETPFCAAVIQYSQRKGRARPDTRGIAQAAEI